MSNIQEAIELLKKAVEYEGCYAWDYIEKRCKDALALLESEPEPTKFTEKARSDLHFTKTLNGKWCLEVCDIIDRLTAENEWLKPYYRFYKHIEAHLTSDEKVICKICGKTLKQIEQE